MRPLVATPWLPLPTALNLRDVGGLPAADGLRVRPGVLLRSGSLRLLDEVDAESLVAEHRVRTVVDLRTPHEVSLDGPSRLADLGVATVHLPLVASAETGIDPASTDVRTALAGPYRRFLHHRGRHLGTLARLLAWSDRGSVLVHCALGKDRTGVAVAVLLAAAGVEREAILDDYARTNEVVDRILPALAVALDMPDRLAAIPLAARRAHPEALALVLDELDREHGGAGAWLVAQGLHPHELARLRHRLLTASGPGTPPDGRGA